MPKITNVSPFGDLDVPLLGLIVAAGETVDVTDEQAAVLLDQPFHWACADDAPADETPAAEDFTSEGAPAPIENEGDAA